MTLREIYAVWDKFWFSEASPLPVATYRILLGTLMMLFVLLLIPDLFVWFGARGMVSNQAVADWSNGKAVYLNLLSFFPDNDNALVIFQICFFLAALSLTVGFKTRVASVLCFMCLATIYHRNPFIFNSGDTYMRVSTFWLMFAAAGNALALDGRRSRHIENGNFDEYTPVSIWPQRLLQLQLTVVYMHTFFCKIVGGPWIEGTAVFTASRIEDLQRLPIPFVFEHAWTINFLTWSTLALEASLFTLIWVKEFRYWVIAAAICFHLTIEYHMNIPLFEWLMIASYVLFIDAKDLARFFKWLHNKVVQKKP
jgi:hypothetical protein